MVLEKLVIGNEENSIMKKKIGSIWFLYYSAFTANLLIFNVGITSMWTSPVIPKLVSNNTEINPLEIPITTSQISLIAALPQIFSALGLIIMAKVTNIIGRKKSMFVTALGFAIAFNTMAFAKHIYIYYVCLSLSGFCQGGFYMNVPIYVTEMAKNSNRGKLGCLVTLSVPTGSLYGYFLGTLLPTKYFIILCSFPAVVHLFLSTFIEESPVYLATKNNKNDAIRILKKLRSTKDYSKLELEYNLIEEYMKSDDKKQKLGVFDLFRSRASRKSFILCLIILISQQTCGVGAILAFVGPIFDKLNSKISGNLVGIIIGSFNTCIYLSTIFIVDKFGRRRLMLLSAFSCCIVMFLLGFNFYMEELHYSFTSSVPWLPVVFIICFILGFGIGLGSLPVLLISELLPGDLRATGLATGAIIETLAAFLVIFSFPLISESFGMYYALWLYSLLNFISFNLFYFFLPETASKNLVEIQELLAK